VFRSDYQFTAAPNSILSLAAKPLGKEAVQAANFTFSEFHTQYKVLVGIPAEPPSDLDQITVAIVDSGIADDVDFALADKRNFVDPDHPQEVTDEHGHGTVIALILRDLAPGVQLIVYKVADANGRVSEWDTLAALAVCAKAHVVNLSLRFGLEDRVCKVCGRESHSSRSAVFENIVGQFANRQQRSLLVGAAGNDGLNKLAFPARFAALLAIGAINSKGELSTESNYGEQYNEGGTPDSRFVCPGGDDATDPPETVGSFGQKDGSYWHGTSFAAAYASGIAANLLAQRVGEDDQYTAILDEIKKNADSKTLVEYDQKKERYGHGLMKLAN
jgi:subtilisin family serine protease